MQISLCQREESNPRIPSVFWILKKCRFSRTGISYEFHPRLKPILMPESWIGWPPLRKENILPPISMKERMLIE
ncbi:hypothetical protein ACSBR2_013237 [Camellia fascicularis]